MPALNRCFGKSSGVLVPLIVYAALILIPGCKKEEVHVHDEHHSDPPIPFTPYALYVSNEESETITVINPVTNESIGHIHISDHNSSSPMLVPHNVQVAPDGNTVWVTGTSHTTGGAEQVVVIKPASNHSIVSKINVGTNQHLAHVVLDSASEFAFVTASQANQVIKIDAENFTEVSRYNLGPAHYPHGLRYSQGNLYVANMDANSLSIINVASGQISEVPLGGKAVQTAVTSDGQFVFISLYDTKEIVKYDVQSQQITRVALPAGSLGPIQLYPTPDNQLLYVCDQGNVGGDPVSNKVYVIDITSFTIVHTITAGSATHGVVVSDDGSKAYVTNSISNTVSVINVATQTVVKTIQVGNAPNGISYRFPTGGMP